MDEWVLKEKAGLKTLGHFETIFTLSNGYIGYRGTPAFAGKFAGFGFYAAGIFNKTPFYKEELVNLPTPLNMAIEINNKTINFSNSKINDFFYILNMKEGILKIKYNLENNGYKLSILEERILHLKYKQVLFEKIRITPVNFTSQIKLFIYYDLNKAYTDVKGKKIRHLKKKEFSLLKSGIYLQAQTTHSRIKISQFFYVLINEKENEVNEIKDNKATKIYDINAQRNKNIELDLYLSTFHSNDTGNCKQNAIKAVKKVSNNRNFINEHKREFIKKWDIADIKIKGDSLSQILTRYNIFNLIGLTPYKKSISIGAKGLHGEGYRGHVFWDTEIYLLPFYLLTNIKAAENILYYRLKRFGQAIKNAKKSGYKGCRYPWESALTGMDVTPEEGDTSKQEHIIVDIAYAILNYMNVSNNQNFIKKLIKILKESAKYFESRVIYDKKEKKYILNDVIGPDEFHQGINNNFYTNYMVKKLFERILKLAKEKKLKISNKKINKWVDIKDNIKLPYSREFGFHEQLDGYFGLKDMKMKIEKDGKRILSKHLMEIYNTPEAVDIFGKTKIIKQADVIMLYCLFFNDFDKELIKKAYLYYDKRTTHGSSLSRAPYAIVEAKIGETKNAYMDFLRAAELDLKDMKNKAGIHAASLGGVYNALIFGFGGLDIDGYGIKINPNLPEKWEGVEFKVYYKNILLKFYCYKDKIRVETNAKRHIQIKTGNKRLTLNKKLEVKF